MNRFLFGALVVASWCVAVATDPPPKTDVAALVRQLCSKDVRQRDEASRQLAALRVDEPPEELLAALKSSDPDVRQRAEKAVTAIRAAALARLPRDQRFAARGQIDLYVASTAALDFKDDDERHWAPATKLGAKVVSLTDTSEGRKPQGGPTWFADFAMYRKAWNVDFVRKDGAYNRPVKNKASERILHQAIQAGGVEAEQSLNGLVVSRGPVNVPQSINKALILATGDVKAGHRVDDSVIVCDGDVRAVKFLGRCVVIARGNITVEGNARTCTLIAGGKVTVTKFEPAEDQNPAIVLPQRVDAAEKDTNPLKFITFFELSRIGLQVKAADGAVTVSSVAAGCTCEKAGLKAGDVILDVGGKKPTDAESLRRLLRDALALGDATVKLKRDTDTLSVKVALPE
jgi:hypothetical protein